MMQLIIMAGVIQAGVLVTFLLRTERGILRANRILASFLFVLLLYLLIPELVRNSLNQITAHLIAVSFPLLYLLGPLLYKYTSLLSKGGNPLGKYSLHFIPSLITVSYFFPFYFSSSIEKISLLEEIRKNGMPGDFILFWNIACVHLLLYLFLCWKRLKSYHKIIEDHYSKTDTINLKWLDHFTIANLLIWGIYFICYVLVVLKIEIDPLGIADKIFGVALTSMIYYMSFVALHRPELFPGPIVKVPNSDRNGSQVADEKIKTYQKSLESFMEQEKPYLDPDLSLNSLSSMTGIPQRSLSQVMNEIYQQNFFDFINTYRVNEAKIRLMDARNNHLTIIAIAFECGFNSKSTFNEVFKRLEKMTPSEYKKNSGKASQR